MKITILAQDKFYSWEGQPGILLSEAIQSCGLSFSMPCGGNHTCGKCRVQAQGLLEPPGKEERRLLGAAKDGIRLACFAKALGDCEIMLPSATIGTALEGILPKADWDSFPPGSFGLAVDIGTTTVAVYLCDLHIHQIIAAFGEPNDQRGLGADVISRIDYSNLHGTEIPHRKITAQLSRMFAQCQKALPMQGEIKALAITGNTTMLHFLTGKNPQGIAAAPFVPESCFGYEMDSGSLFPEYQNIPLYLPPCVGAYVGADILCAAASVRLAGQENALLLDIGTNGEMMLMTQGKCLCCAAAAGPAFEGAGISMGMAASEGAVNRVAIKNGEIVWETIGHTAPAGICGTGVISLLCLMRKTGALDETGLIIPEGIFAPYITKGERIQLGNSNIFFTQEDVRAVQLAKAAIAAGLETLLHEGRIKKEQINMFYLCGGFGSRIDCEEAAGIGLIPAALVQKAVTAGNGAGAGAAAMVMSQALRQEAEQLAREAIEISLSESAYFMEQYLEQMAFEA